MWTRGKMWKQISLSISHRYLYYNHSLYSLRFFSCLRWIIVTISYLEFASLQERSKYLRGYHDCTKEDMITLGGLLFRVKVESDMSQFVMIPKMLKDLVPADQQKIMSPDEWKKVKNKLYRSTPQMVYFMSQKMGLELRCKAILCFIVFLAAHHFLIQAAEWHHSGRSQNRLPKNHFKLANLWLCLLWS